jgi:hypothetical protein
MQRATLRYQDRSLAALFALFDEAKQWDNTLVIVVGDAAMGDPPSVPFDDQALGEDSLTPPLIVKFPAGRHAGQRNKHRVFSIDLTRTILDSLDVPLPDGIAGWHLEQIVEGAAPAGGRIEVAQSGARYSARLGEWLLRGTFGKTPRLCHYTIDPACVTDAFSEHPRIAATLWSRLFQHVIETRAKSQRAGRRTVADIDAETAAALTVWGH